MSFTVEYPLLRAKNNGTVPFFVLHNILISKIAAIYGSEYQLAIQYAHTWVGNAPESRRTTSSLSLTLLFGIG